MSSTILPSSLAPSLALWLTTLEPTAKRTPPFQWLPPSLYVFIVLYSILIIAISICNIIVIHLYTRMDMMAQLKIPNILLLNQALVDLLIGLSSLPRLVCSSSGCPNKAHWVTFFFVEYTTFLALGALLCGTLERYLSVKVPLIHRENLTKHRVATILMCIWVVTTIPALAYVLYILGTRDKTLADRYYEIAYCILIFFTLVVFILLGATYRLARALVVSTGIEEQKNRERQKKVTRVFLMMAIAYMVTILPHIVGSVVLDAVRIPGTLQEIGEVINVTKTSFHLFYITSALINPIITVVDKPDFRRSFRSQLCRRQQQETVH